MPLFSTSLEAILVVISLALCDFTFLGDFNFCDCDFAIWASTILFKYQQIEDQNGSYGIKVGVRMPQKSEFVCHKSRFVHYILCESPFIPLILWHILGQVFLLIWGVGVVKIVYKIIARMKFQFSIYFGDYRYSFQGFVELICISITVSLFDFCRMQLHESLMSVNIFAHNSGAGNGCVSFMGAWDFLVLWAGRPPCGHAHKHCSF